MDQANWIYQLAVDDLATLGPYRLLGRIYHDARTTTYVGEDADGRRVSVTSAGRGAFGPALVRRLRAEMERLWRVPSSCVPRLLDAKLEHDPPYLVREYVDGPSLAQSVQWHGTFAGSGLRGFVDDLAALLEGLHGIGVTHGAMTPDKLLLGSQGMRLIGFATERTGTGPEPGEHAFAAPEALNAAPNSWPGPAEDVFGWGCLAVHAATARSPFAGDSRAAVISNLLDGRPNVDGVPEPMRQIVEAALSPDPADRPTMAQVITALNHDRNATATREPVARPLESGRFRHSPAYDSPAYDPPAHDQEPAGLGDEPDRPAAHAAGDKSRRLVAIVAVLVLAGIGGTVLLLNQKRDSDASKAPVSASGTDSAGGAAQSGTAQSGTAQSAAPQPENTVPTANDGKAGPTEPRGGEEITVDPLTKPAHWANGRFGDDPGNCLLDEGLQATLNEPGRVQCLGPTEEETDDVGIEVTATLQAAGTCATVWFHADAYASRGSGVQFCEKQVVVSSGDKQAYKSLPLAKPTALQQPALLHLVLRDRKVAIWRDHGYVGTVALPGTETDTGQVILGVTSAPDAGAGPFKATFKHIETRSL